MEKDILKILNKLKEIKPDPDYAKKSRMLILVSKQNELKSLNFGFKNFTEILRFSAVVGLAGFLLLSLLEGVFYVNKNFSPLALEGLNQKSLITEAEGINNSIQITLKEIKYLDQSNKKTINMINEISKNEPVYSNIPMNYSSAEATSTEDIENFLIESPTSTDINGQNINSLLDKVAQ